MEEVKNKITKVSIGDYSLAVTKGYGYTNKNGDERYSYNESYLVDGDKTLRKHSNDKGEFYYNVELVDVVIEEFLMKDGNKGSKTYPLSEVPYLAKSADLADEEVLKNYLEFKLHR